MIDDVSGRTVLYFRSIDEATACTDFSLTAPENGEDWGLVSDVVDDRVQIEFVYSEETVVVPVSMCESLVEDEHASVVDVDDATRTVLEAGSDAILDVKHGEPPLTGITNVLGEAVGSVFVMQAENGMREWPSPPETPC